MHSYIATSFLMFPAETSSTTIPKPRRCFALALGVIAAKAEGSGGGGKEGWRGASFVIFGGDRLRPSCRLRQHTVVVAAAAAVAASRYLHKSHTTSASDAFEAARCELDMKRIRLYLFLDLRTWIWMIPQTASACSANFCLNFINSRLLLELICFYGVLRANCLLITIVYIPVCLSVKADVKADSVLQLFNLRMVMYDAQE